MNLDQPNHKSSSALYVSSVIPMDNDPVSDDAVVPQGQIRVAEQETFLYFSIIRPRG
jgi:hypothetical protein